MESRRWKTYAAAVSDARTDLVEFLEHYSPPKHGPSIDADVFGALGIDGDDAFEFMSRLTAKFGIDADKYRWYFHRGEEGWNLGGVFFRPPYRRVERMPITTRTLIEAIETKCWPLQYPAHKLPSVRWDIRLNQFLIVVAFIPLALLVWGWFVR